MIKRIIVDRGFDKADQVIAKSIKSGDIVITYDLILAESCITKQAQVISP